MPSIVGSIPDTKTAPLADYLSAVRSALGERTVLTYNDFLLCLLIAALEDMDVQL